MSAVAIGAPRQYIDRGWPAVAALIEIEGRRHEVYVRATQGPLSTSVGPFVLTALVPAMKLGQPLRVEAPLSAQFLALLSRTAQRMAVTRPQQHPVSIETVGGAVSAALPAQHDDRRGVGLFFSGGVDSFHSLLRRRDEISHLIYVHGFDSLLSSQAIRARNVRALRQAAAELSMPLMEVETNLRQEMDRYEAWTHPRAIAVQLALALALAPQFKRIYVAENYSYIGEWPADQVPLVLSADGVDAVFDGTDCLRVDKTAYITSSQTAMRWLRVCWEDRGAYNCGRCEKCLRTMIALDLAGALSRCRTFDRPIDLERVRYTNIATFARFWPELLVRLEQRGDKPALTKAVRDALGWGTARANVWNEMLPVFEQCGDQPAITEVVRELARREQVGASPQEQAERLHKLMKHIADLDRELDIMKTSSSWKLTAPLRAAGRLLRRRR